MDKKRTTFTKGEQPRFIQAVEATLQAEDPDKMGMAQVKGQAACYGNWFTVADMATFQIQRRNNPGMFQRSLAQNPDIALRVNHQDALARTQAGTLKVWEEDDGLYFEGRVNTNTQAGNDIVQNMRDGLVTQGSVMYWPVELEEWSDTANGITTEYQDIIQGKLSNGDVSLVMWGANPKCETTLAQMAQMATRLGEDKPLSSAPEDASPNRAARQARARARMSWRNKLLDDPVAHLQQVAERDSGVHPEPPALQAGEVAVEETTTPTTERNADERENHQHPGPTDRPRCGGEEPGSGSDAGVA